MLGAVVNGFAQDWPQYPGPDRNSISSQENILRSWSDEGPEVLWAADIGIGYGGPVVKDGKVYLLDRDDEIGDIMRCFDVKTKKPVWNRNIWTDFGGILPEDGMPVRGGVFPMWAISQCPLIFGDLLILASQAPGAGVVAYDRNSGELEWKPLQLAGPAM